MDVISLGKANQILKKIKELDETIVAPLAEDRFKTVDERLDWLEAQASKLLAENTHPVDFTQGTASGTEVVNGKVQLKKLGEAKSNTLSNLIPVLTSDTSHSPIVVSASSVVNSAYAAYRAFDGFWSTEWVGNKSPSLSLSVDFGTAKIANGYSVQSGISVRTPSAWVFEGSNDNINWQALDVQSGQTWTNEKKTVYYIINENSYRYYRLNSLTSSDANYVGVGSFEILSYNQVLQYSPSGTYETPIIDLGEGWQKTKLVDVLKQIKSGGYTVDIVPAMTGDTTPSGTVSVSSKAFAATYGWKAFDDSNADPTYGGWWAATQQNEWIAYEFTQPKKIQKYTLTSESPHKYAPSTWDFEGWNGTQWVKLDSRANITWGTLEKKDFTFINNSSYQKYRLYIHQGYNGAIAIIEMEMMEALPGTDCMIELSSSTDGITFTPYAALDVNSLPQARYVKIRATLSAVGQNAADRVLDFNQSSLENTFILNEFTEAAGELKLKNSFSEAMIAEGALGVGNVMSSIIDKSKFSKIEKVEVK
jgi:hypothetical protein